MMAADMDSTVLFHRGTAREEEDDSDVWDDTALIEAYDAAVAPLKAKLAERTGDTSVLDSGNKTSATGPIKKKKRAKKKKQGKKKQQAGGWQEGSFCQAVFTEDGSVYEAKILSINHDENTCVVRYLGYGNEEEQSLEDLMKPGHSSRKQQKIDSFSCSETESVTSRQSSAGQRESKKIRSSAPPWGAGAMPSFPSFSQSSSHHHPPPPPLPPHFPGMPSQSTFAMPRAPMGSAASMPFSMMPPPPPPMPNDSVGDENEALCSMLLSWYMSGYHTGYYQGLRQSQNDASAAMGPSR